MHTALISKQITFWEIIAMQFVHRYKIEIGQNETKTTSSYLQPVEQCISTPGSDSVFSFIKIM